MSKQKAYFVENINGKNNFEQRQIDIPTPKENEVINKAHIFRFKLHRLRVLFVKN